MLLTSINTGSSGNCYVLEINGNQLLLDCGVAYMEIARTLNFKVSKIVACLLTHEHGDHSKGAKELLRRGINVYTSKGTSEALGLKCKTLECNKEVTIGDFRIIPFDVPHDAAQPFGYLIQHPEVGTIAFITDAMYCKYKFPGLKHVLIEANYDIELVKNDPEYLRHRIIKSHMSIDTCCDFIKTNLKDLETVTLLHLSDRNSDQVKFEKKVREVSGVRVYVAEKNKKINLI